MFSQDAWIFVSFVHFCEEKLRRALPILFLAIFQARKKTWLFMLWLVISIIKLLLILKVMLHKTIRNNNF